MYQPKTGQACNCRKGVQRDIIVPRARELEGGLTSRLFRAQHTPTPWHHIPSNRVPAIYGESKRLAQVHMHEDAAFIVRAVNSHDELLEALKKSQKLIHDSNLCDVGCCDECTDGLQAIAKAEGK